MSSDSEEDFFYTNSASILKAIKRDISLCEVNDLSFEIDNLTNNKELNPDLIELDNSDENKEIAKADDIIDLDKVDEINHRPIESVKLRSKKNSNKLLNNNDSCIILSDDEEVHNSPATNLISTIDKILDKGKKRNRPIRQTKNNTRGRGRGRGRGAKTSNRQSTLRSHCPTYDLTNLEDSPIINIEKKKQDDHDSLQEANYEIDIKVWWKSQYLEKFKIRRFDRLQVLFKYFAEKENISEENLIFTIQKNNDVVISKNDTPDSLNINAATIIEGGVRTGNTQFKSSVSNKLDKDCVELKILLKDRKRPLMISMRTTDRMEVMMHKTATELQVDVKRLKFYFDGDLIKSSDDLSIYQMEGGECIDCMNYN